MSSRCCSRATIANLRRRCAPVDEETAQAGPGGNLRDVCLPAGRTASASSRRWPTEGRAANDGAVGPQAHRPQAPADRRPRHRRRPGTVGRDAGPSQGTWSGRAPITRHSAQGLCATRATCRAASVHRTPSTPGPGRSGDDRHAVAEPATASTERLSQVTRAAGAGDSIVQVSAPRPRSAAADCARPPWTWRGEHEGAGVGARSAGRDRRRLSSHAPAHVDREA